MQSQNPLTNTPVETQNKRDCVQTIIPKGGTNYIKKINTVLIPKISKNSPLVIDLFAGCGGLSLGFEANGFKTLGYEVDMSCCETYNKNLSGNCIQHHITTKSTFEDAKVIIGGPPCQPFSVRGKQAGEIDSRNGFPSFVAAISKYKPEFWLFENVRGVFYKNKQYIEEMISELQLLGYIIEFKLLNAVNYGVPQNRERIFVCGHKGKFIFPEPLIDKLPAGVAIWDTATTTPPESKFLTKNQDQYISVYEEKSKCIKPRDLHLDIPARTLTCRNLAGATSDMHRIRLPDGKRRRLLIQEAKRLQSFPDWFEFAGNETSQFNQIGNAVPPLMSFHIAESVANYLNNPFRYNEAEILQINSSRKILL
jgi:DNA (cytosine-5)-methyltransferase 1